jgi:DNA-binding transcriptional ArsR family regulator
MSSKRANALTAPRLLRQYVAVFAALSDETRLALLARLIDGVPCSISQLTEDSKMTRQAVTKHLRVLERAGLVRGETAGRQCLFELEPRPLEEIRDYLDRVSKQWDAALSRLKKFVETEG